MDGTHAHRRAGELRLLGGRGQALNCAELAGDLLAALSCLSVGLGVEREKVGPSIGWAGAVKLGSTKAREHGPSNNSCHLWDDGNERPFLHLESSPVLAASKLHKGRSLCTFSY